MISPLSFSARISVTSDLPDAVGPARKMAFSWDMAGQSKIKIGSQTKRPLGSLFGNGGPGWFALHLLPPGEEEKKPNAGANGRICDVESRETDLSSVTRLEIKINEIDDVLARRRQPVDQISDNPAKNKAKGNLPKIRSRIKVMSKQEQNQERYERNDSQKLVIAVEHAPGRAGVAPMHKFEKAGYDHFFIRVGEILENDKLGELVEEDSRRGNNPHPPVRFCTHVSRYFIPRDNSVCKH